MPKMKTRQSIAKRVRVSGTGKLMALHVHPHRLNQRKSQSSKRSSSVPAQITGGDEKVWKRALPYPQS